MRITHIPQNQLKICSDYGGSYGDQGSSAVMGGGGQFPGLSSGLAGMLGSIGNLTDADNAIMSMMNDLLIPLPIGQHGGKTPEQLRQELCNLNNALAAAAGALIRFVRFFIILCFPRLYCRHALIAGTCANDRLWWNHTGMPATVCLVRS